MLTLPALFSVSYWSILKIPHSVQRAHFLQPSTWLVTGDFIPADDMRREEVEEEEGLLGIREDRENSVDVTSRRRQTSTTLERVLPLLKFMIPLISVYLAEYYINQGLVSYTLKKIQKMLCLIIPRKTKKSIQNKR